MKYTDYDDEEFLWKFEEVHKEMESGNDCYYYL